MTITMTIELKTPNGFPFLLTEIPGDLGGKHRYYIGPNFHSADYELATTDIAYVSEPWLEKADIFMFLADNSMAVCNIALPGRNAERNRFDISDIDGFFRLSAGFRCHSPVPPMRQRFLCLESRTIFAFSCADLPMKSYRLSNSFSILSSFDGMYCGWSMRNFLRFAEFDGEFAGVATSDLTENETEYKAMDFIFSNYCDEIMEEKDMDNEETVSRMESIARHEQWPFRSKIFCFTLAGLKDFYF
jgi:hypothetical protein